MRSFITITILLTPFFTAVSAYPTPVPSAAELHMREYEDDGSSVSRRDLFDEIAEQVRNSGHKLTRGLLDPFKDFGEDVKETAVENWEKLGDEASKIKITPPTISTE